VNPGFTKRIIDLRDEESDALLKLLFKVRLAQLPLLLRFAASPDFG
jgi:hypothetical protein